MIAVAESLLWLNIGKVTLATLVLRYVQLASARRCRVGAGISRVGSRSGDVVLDNHNGKPSSEVLKKKKKKKHTRKKGLSTCKKRKQNRRNIIEGTTLPNLPLLDEKSINLL